MKIEEIDKKIFLLDIKIPYSLEKKINFLGIYINNKNKSYKKIAIFIIILFFSVGLLSISNTIAIKRIILQVVSFQTLESLDGNL